MSSGATRTHRHTGEHSHALSAEPAAESRTEEADAKELALLPESTMRPAAALLNDKPLTNVKDKYRSLSHTVDSYPDFINRLHQRSVP